MTQQDVPKKIQQALDKFWEDFAKAQEDWGAKPATHLPADGVKRVAISGRTFTKNGDDPWKME
ncbi:MAG: hypothetical protein K9G48_14255 [Reyranella sp.]|nr:hypothetical protein [Reyranella sp.]